MKELLSVVVEVSFPEPDHQCGPDCLCWESQKKAAATRQFSLAEAAKSDTRLHLKM